MASLVLLELAENSNSYQPLAAGEERLVDDRYIVYLGPRSHPAWTVVQRLRLRPEDVEPTVAEIRELLRLRGRTAATWEVGSSATPADLVPRLEALGMVPDREPLAIAMVLTEPPAAAPADVRVTRVESFEDFRVADLLAHEVFGLAPPAEEQSRARWEAEPPASAVRYLAWVDGEPVATATATFTAHGVVLNAGSTLERARGRGAYRALVAARWEDAVARGTPALVTQAGAMSRPILRRLGFREVAEIRILLDELATQGGEPSE